MHADHLTQRLAHNRLKDNRTTVGQLLTREGTEVGPGLPQTERWLCQLHLCGPGQLTQLCTCFLIPNVGMMGAPAGWGLVKN